VVAARSGFFSRSPKSTARSIVERWIFEQQGQLRGGRVVILGKQHAEPKAFDASVRIRILAGDGSGRQLAVAYIGADVVRRTGKDAYSMPSAALLAAGHLGTSRGRG
jgi:hypothetical protein